MMASLEADCLGSKLQGVKSVVVKSSPLACGCRWVRAAVLRADVLKMELKMAWDDWSSSKLVWVVFPSHNP